MKILALWHDSPSPYTGGSLPAFNMLKYLSQKHNITLLTFREITEEARYSYDLGQYCEVMEPLSIAVPKSLLKQILYTTRNTLPPQNLFSRNPSFFNFYYSPKMQARIRNLLATRSFDLIYTSTPMAHYVQNVDMPKVVHTFDSTTEIYRQKYLSMGSLSAKFFWWFQYLRIRMYESHIFKKFDASIVVSPHEQKTVEALFPNVNALVVPNGVDSEFFSPAYQSEEHPSLIFVGDMRYQPNIDAMLYFHSQIYGNIKENVPQVKLYIVGRDPPKEVQGLSSDKSVIVTEYVEDVRPYLVRASVVLAPFISGTTGIKNKVLEAMAMAKPVVSTSMGVQGITMATNEHVIVADEPEEFARQVVKLLSDMQLRQTIGSNGRRLVETSYSWESAAEQLDSIFQQVLNR